MYLINYFHLKTKFNHQKVNFIKYYLFIVITHINFNNFLNFIQIFICLNFVFNYYQKYLSLIKYPNLIKYLNVKIKNVYNPNYHLNFYHQFIFVYYFY